MKKQWKHPGPFIKKCLIAKGYKQVDIVRELNMVQSSVSGILLGKLMPKTSFLVWLEEHGIGTAEKWAIHCALYKLHIERTFERPSSYVMEPRIEKSNREHHNHKPRRF